MKKLYSLIFCASVAAHGQLPFTKTVSLGNWETDPEFKVIQVQEINTAIILHRPNRPTACPVTLYKEFILEKLNPSPNRYLIEDYVCQAKSPDSTVYNFGFIYKVFNYEGKMVYMQVIEGDKMQIKLNFTKEQPPLELVKRASEFAPRPAGKAFLTNGKSAIEATPASPKFIR